MTLDLDPIKARLDAGAQGKWVAEVDPYDNLKFNRIVTGDNLHNIARSLDDADADLIAHAPADLRALIAEVERLRAELAAYQQSTPTQSTHYSGCYDSGPRHYECALAEINRLREVIRELVEAINDMGEGECEIDRLYNTIARAERVLSETKPTDGPVSSV